MAQAEQSRNVIYRLSNTVLCIFFFLPSTENVPIFTHISDTAFGQNRNLIVAGLS